MGFRYKCTVAVGSKGAVLAITDQTDCLRSSPTWCSATAGRVVLRMLGKEGMTQPLGAVKGNQRPAFQNVYAVLRGDMH